MMMIVSLLDCVDENLSEAESSDSDNKESDHKTGTADSEQSNREGTPAVSG
jgi:hypothetical protein